MKTTITLLATLLLPMATLSAASASAAETVTMESLLTEMIDTTSPARWPEPVYSCKQASSYDRKQVAPDKPGWFANGDFSQYIRSEERDGRKELVMMDADGPGAIVRFWLTTGSDKQGTIRVYLDGESAPALTFPAYDLLTGDLKLAPPLAQPHPGYSPHGGGNTLYLPIPYAKHCKVTWEETSKGARYYQLNYRTYPAGTPVKSFSKTDVESARPLIDRVNQALLAPTAPAGQPLALNQSIAAGAELSLELPAGPAAIRSLELRVKPEDTTQLERTLRSTIVRIRFDGEESVWCPASDFFGSGVGLNPLQSWYRTVTTDGVMSCRWTMPYQKSATITLANVGEKPVTVALTATTAPWSWDARSMHFHCAWHYQSGLKTPPASDWNYIKITGRGVYIGDTLALFNPVATWYGEGDEKIWVDGESFPSHQGTGTEDYYSFSYAPKPVHQTPFTNEPRIDHPSTQGHNTLTRSRNLDGIPFTQSLQFDMELIAWKPVTLTYAATTYWYAFSGVTSNLPTQPRDAALPLPTLAEAQAAAKAAIQLTHKPGAIECETMKLRTKSDGLEVHAQEMTAWDAAGWSGGAQLLVAAKQAGDFVELELPAPDAGARKLVLYATQAPDYGLVRFSINGTTLVKEFDGFATHVKPSGPIELGIFTAKEGKFILRAELAGANAKATGHKYYFGLDAVVVSAP